MSHVAFQDVATKKKRHTAMTDVPLLDFLSVFLSADQALLAFMAS